VLNSASHPPTNMSTSSTGYGYINHILLVTITASLVFVLQATKAGRGGLGTRLITATPSGLLF